MGNEESHQAIVGRQFGQRSNSYLTSQVHAQGGDLDELVRLATGHRPSAALDLGCGGGHVAYRLAPLVDEMHACDLSEDMIATVSAEAKRRGLDNVIAKRAAVERLPYADRAFDMVVTRYSAHHWYDFSTGLSQARRVLKSDGFAVFIDVVSPGSPLLDTWFQTLELLRDPSHVYNRSEAEWREAVETAGFRPDGVSHFKLRLDFASWIGRMRTPDAHVAAIRSLQSLAAREVAEHFQFEADGSFAIDSMLLVARPV